MNFPRKIRYILLINYGAGKLLMPTNCLFFVKGPEKHGNSKSISIIPRIANKRNEPGIVCSWYSGGVRIWLISSNWLETQRRFSNASNSTHTSWIPVCKLKSKWQASTSETLRHPLCLRQKLKETFCKGAYKREHLVDNAENISRMRFQNNFI